MRSKRALYNSIASLLLQLVTMICGFVLPRLILSSFGSSYNGITSSISQFLSVIALLRAGVGGVTRASLYKSLAKKDDYEISATIRATEIFMRKVALVFACCVVVFSCVYPIFVKNEFSWIFSSTLVLIISFSTFIQYYFGITYQMLLQADQRQYIYSLMQIVVTILNTLLAAVLIKCNLGIHSVKLGSSAVFCITPIFLHIYVRKYYHINTKIKPDFSKIKQRWDAFFHQVATFVHTNTDIALLTVFTNMKEISVYSVYYLVANGLRQAVLTIASGIEAAFGNMIAKDEKDLLNKNVQIYEMLIHFSIAFFFSVALVLITPFVLLYTNGVKDVNYERVLFGYLVLIGEMIYCARSPYEMIINAAGHYKQTKKYVCTEAVINLVISICMVYRYGLIGVIIGTIVSIIYRTVVFSYYASVNILERRLFIFIKRFLITIINVVLVFLILTWLKPNDFPSYVEWILFASISSIISFVITLIFNFTFYKKEVLEFLRKLKVIFKSFLRK